MILKKYFEPKVMTKEEFLSYHERRYGDKPLRLNKRLTTMLTFVFANLIWVSEAMAKANMGQLNSVGNTMLEIVRTFGYWICLIMCIVEIIKTLLSGDTRGIGRIIVKYLLGFGAFYFMPFLFDTVKEAFK